MSDSASASYLDDEVLAQFVRDYEAASNPDAVAADYSRRYAHLAPDVQAFAALNRRLRLAAPSASEGARRLETGRTVGPFRIERLLAAGGMGEIYQAEEAVLRRRVAIKVIRRGRDAPEVRARFEREQRVLARLHQTHIIPVYAAGEDGDLLYFAMPYIEGASLHHVVEALRTHQLRRPGSTPSLADVVSSLVGSVPTPPEDTTTPVHASADTSPDEITVRRRERRTLTSDYFRSVAQLLAEAADALHHAHLAGVCHRDIKPSNLMVDRTGHCWIIDFGLAGFLDAAADSHSADSDTDECPALTIGPMGTPAYMAPEQYSGGPLDRRSDVWALGVTLYELLTLRRAFDGVTASAVRTQVLSGTPIPPGELVRHLPADLAAITNRAIQKDPARRYASAAEFAADLRRWLNFEPTVAYPGRVVRRVALWTRRNKGWAALLAFMAAAAVGTALIGHYLDGLKTEVATEQANSANERAAALEARERQRLHETHLQDLHRLCAPPHAAGWSRAAWDIGRKAAEFRSGADVRDRLILTRTGLDARYVAEASEEGASSVVFAPDGRSLAIGGTGRQFSRLWSVEDKARPCGVQGDGPVAFRSNGTPVQLVLPSERRQKLRLYDLASGRILHQTPLPGGAETTLTDVALAADASCFAIATSTLAGGGEVVVWKTGQQTPLRRIDRPATALAFSPDCNFLALGDDRGSITVWPLPAGEPREVAQPRGPAIRSLAFGRNPWLLDGQRSSDDSSGLLAAGDAGGTVTVWNWAARSIISFCRGSSYDVHAVGFSPDGMTLASAGRGDARIWDLATGRLLLKLVPPRHNRNQMTGLTFSADGRQLAISSIAAFGYQGGVDVWELEDGRGVRVLRGLSGCISRVALSPDGRQAAALSHNWQVSVWTLGQPSRLCYVLDGPRGVFADNAALVFAPDGRFGAVAAGRQVRRWDTETGATTDSWELPPGLQDQLAFLPSGKLLSVRFETQDGQDYPASNAHPAEHPRVCRIRELNSSGASRLLAEIKDFNWHVYLLNLAPDGSYFLVEGLHGPRGQHREVRAYEGMTGKLLWSRPQERIGNSSLVRLDSAGQTAIVPDSLGRTPQLVAMPAGTPSSVLARVPDGGVAPGAQLWGARDPILPYGLSLYEKHGSVPLVTLDFGEQIRSESPLFDAAGRQLIWGGLDGSIRICDVAEVRRQLAQVGLGW